MLFQNLIPNYIIESLILISKCKKSPKVYSTVFLDGFYSELEAHHIVLWFILFLKSEILEFLRILIQNKQTNKKGETKKKRKEKNGVMKNK